MERLLAHNNILRNSRYIRSFRRRFNMYVYSLYSQKFIEFEGRKMYLDKDDSLHLSIRDYAPTTKELVKRVVKKGDVVVDVGAHVGYYSLLFAELVGEKGHVFSFEPSTNCEILKKNIEINSYKNITAVQKAVSNETTVTKLHLTPSLTTHHICNTNRDDSNSVEIQTTTLDDYFCKKNQISVNFIKCDAEGHELEVLKGGEQLLRKFHPIISLESEARHCGIDNVMSVFNFLNKLDYKGFFVDAGSMLSLDNFNIEKHQLNNDEKNYVNNFFFIPKQ